MRISDGSSDVCSSDLSGSATALITSSICGAVVHASARAGPVANPRAMHTAPPYLIIGRTLRSMTLGIWLSFRVDRKSVVSGQSVSVRLDLGGHSIITKTTQIEKIEMTDHTITSNNNKNENQH